MEYKKVVEGKFISRPNRFIAHVEIDGREEIAHVKNTGRCKELLIPGVKVYLEDCRDNPVRKTKFDLIAVEKGKRLINMDSQSPNKAAGEFLKNRFFKGKDAFIKPEYTYDKSRIDFFAECEGDKYLIEVKGVTLESEDKTYFPDAPTERGIKHLEELSKAVEEGYKCAILFVIQMEDVVSFQPNEITHPQFGEALRKAKKAGVVPMAYSCVVTPSSMVVDKEVPVIL